MGRRVYGAEFKREAVSLVRDRGVTIRQAAADLGLHEGLLGRWVKAMRQDPKQAFPGKGQQKPDDAEMSRLKRELAKTRMERDILKKGIAYFAKEPQ